MPIDNAFNATGWPVRREEEGPWIDGERDAEETVGDPFDCGLFLPTGEKPATPRGGRSVRRPTLIYEPEDRIGQTLALSHEDEVDVVAPEINLAEGRDEDEVVRWSVDGKPQPFGRPGDEPVGFQATLLKVDD